MEATKMRMDTFTWRGKVLLWQLPLLLLTHIVSSASGSAHWSSGDLQIKQGGDLTVTCTLKNVDFFGVARISRTVPSTQQADIISDNDILKTKFAETGRYNVTSVWKGNDVELTLSYKSLRGEDTGEISCFKLGQKNSGASFLLRVLVPIKDVYFLVESGEESGEFRPEAGDVVFLRQGQPSSITCMFERDGTMFPPTMEIEVGGQSEFGRFLRKDFPVDEKLDVGGWREAMTVKMTYDTMTPPADFNDKNLTCRGTVDGYDSIETTIKLDVEFAPIITCPKYEWYGQLRRAMTVTCQVTANPGSTIAWYYGADRESAEIIEDDDRAFIKKNKAFSAVQATVSLTIRRLNESAHLTNFYLAASNDVDAKEVTVTVSEGARDTDPEVHIQPKPNRPSYSTNQNKPSKRPRAREPQPVLGGSTGLLATSLLVSVMCACSLMLATSRR